MNAEKWRNIGLVFLFAGFFVMYLGVYDKPLIPVLTCIGAVGVLAGIGIYFRFGPISGSGRRIQCPRCGQVTRLTGSHDQCAHCKQPMRRTATGDYEPYVP
ncbi:MAG: hypothetical protein IRZ10_07235 [Thermoflavifilum sp.]|nr:hypothetical protein [Thermoflavifilum sp.]MCL6514201.1 hypothetical protein [Alicyclobacillus sp.]